MHKWGKDRIVCCLTPDQKVQFDYILSSVWESVSTVSLTLFVSVIVSLSLRKREASSCSDNCLSKSVLGVSCHTVYFPKAVCLATSLFLALGRTQTVFYDQCSECRHRCLLVPSVNVMVCPFKGRQNRIVPLPIWCNLRMRLNY
jgi:hypothetical protein